MHKIDTNFQAFFFFKAHKHDHTCLYKTTTLSSTTSSSLVTSLSQNRLQSVNFHNINHNYSDSWFHLLPSSLPTSINVYTLPGSSVLCRHTEWLMLCIPMLTLKPLINALLLLHIQGPWSSCWSLWCQSTLSLTMLKNNVNFLSIPT